MVHRMARPLRLEFPGAVYHLTARGNAQQAIYIDDGDRNRFLGLLGREIRQHGWRCHAYCLMPNHYHLLIETPEGNLVNGMRQLNGVYTQAFNHRHGRVGHLFQGRYKSIIVERESYLLELCRYIVLNPVRANMVTEAGLWPWSSYRVTVGLDNEPTWLERKWLLRQFGVSKEHAQSAYQLFVTEGLRQTSPWKHLRGQIWLGNKPFLQQMEQLIACQPLQDIPLEQTRPMRPGKEELLNVVSRTYGVDETDLVKRLHPAAYQAAVYALRRVANLRLAEVAGIFRVSPSRISRIQQKIEERKPDHRLDALLKMYKVKN